MRGIELDPFGAGACSVNVQPLQIDDVVRAGIDRNAGDTARPPTPRLRRARLIMLTAWLMVTEP